MNPEPPPIADPHSTETRPPTAPVKRGPKTKQDAASRLGAGALLSFWTFCCGYTLWDNGAFSHWPPEGETIALAAFGLFFLTFAVLSLVGAIQVWMLGGD